MSSLPDFVVRPSALTESEARYPPPFDGVKLSFGRDVGRAAGSRTLGAWVDRVEPGGRSSFAHAHLREEELVYVISGTPTLRWIPPGGPASEVELAPGDFVSFPAGTGIAHTFLNASDEDVSLLVVGERRNGERAVYPDDPMFEAWRGENRPDRVWPDLLSPAGHGAWPAYRIETPRLVLRPWAVEDTPELLRLLTQNHEHLARFMPWARALPSADELLGTIRTFNASFANDEDWVYGIFLPDGTPIGSTGLHPRIGPHGLEIGYWIAEDRQGHGYVSESTAALVRLAVTVKRAHLVEIHCDPANARSAAVPDRLGFTHVGTLPGRGRTPLGEPRDTMVWSLVASEFSTSPAAAVPVVARDGLGRRLA